MPRDWLDRLKQRSVFRATALYAAVGYAVIQISNNLLPALRLPSWSQTLLALLYLLGFPIVIGLSWAFEYRDGALRRSAGRAGRGPMGWFDWSLLAASGAIFLFAAIHLGRTQSSREPAQASTPAMTVAAPVPAPAAVAAPQRSIAVLPFVNLSDETDGEYFADGLTEEIINVLAQIPDLRVAGRTSTFYFKGRAGDLREIGGKLGVAYVLEGSVRRSGTSRRITAQLVSVSDGFHLWSENFDRAAQDVLAMQTQISRAVAGALKLRLVDTPPGTGDRDPQNWKLELVAKSRLRKQELTEVQTSRTQFAELRRLEPDNARAHIGYAEATLTLAQNFLALDFDPALRESKDAVAHALQLDPALADAWRVKGLIARIEGIRTSDARHGQSAVEAFQRALELDPGNADALAMLASQRLGQGQDGQAIALLRRALAIDPLSRIALRMLGDALAQQGQLPQADAQFRELVELYPDYTDARVALAELQIEQGKLDEAIRVLEHGDTIQDDPQAGFILTALYANLGMDIRSRATLARLHDPPAAGVMADAIELLLKRDYRGFANYAGQQLAASDDPIWRSGRLMAAVMLDEATPQRELTSDLANGLRQQPPAISTTSPLDALLYATALRRYGEAAQGERIVQAVLQRYTTTPGRYDPPGSRWIRGMANASLGHTVQALADLEAAQRAGYRNLIDFDYVQRVQDYPFMASLRSEPRFQRLISGMESANRKMRAALIQAGTPASGAQQPASAR